MKPPKILVAVPHSHTWLWTQTCLSKYREYTQFPYSPTGLGFCVIDNSWEWSPAIRGITDTDLGQGVRVRNNTKMLKYHGSALDLAFENTDADFVLTIETDTYPQNLTWLTEMLSRMRPTDYAVGAWHHEQFINPSYTLYRVKAWREMREWCLSPRDRPREARWGERFEEVSDIPDFELASVGPFVERRGWPAGTTLDPAPSGQLKGPCHYEPGQAFHHWAVHNRYTCTIVPTHTTYLNGIPTGTYYGVTEGSDIGKGFAAHAWGGTRALDRLKHAAFLRAFGDAYSININDDTINRNMGYWLKREAELWRWAVPSSVRDCTTELIRKYGWVLGNITTDEQRELDVVLAHYRSGGVDL